MTHPNDPALRSFLPIDAESDFPIQNLPYGVFSTSGSPKPRVGVAIGESILDLAVLESEGLIDLAPAGVFAQPSINAFMAAGPEVWSGVRARISELLRHDIPYLRDNRSLRDRALVPMRDAKLHLPITVAGYTDFYSSREHATNVGIMF
ncbi:MAG: fumarylacetoacetase, partial [Bradyrhizobium sp.]|nr:fumarylacetoacetase [Bradyrhizobium sp.]